MTVVKKNILKKVKEITLGSTFLLTLIGGATSCQSSSESEEGSYEIEETYTKGVKTYISETSKGEFKITDEKEVPLDSAMAVVTYLDGTTENINPKLAKELIDNNLNQNSQANYGHRSGLSNVLLYGGMGYMFARMNGQNNVYANSRQNYERNNTTGSSGFYASPSTYQKAQAVHQNVGSSRIRTSRPTNSRSGFFSGSSRSSSRG